MTCAGAAIAGCADGGSGGRRDGSTSDAARGDGSTSGECQFDEDCADDGIFCNGRLICRENRCIASAIPTCDDGISCTRDECVTATDECQNTPDDTACPDGTACYLRIGCSEAPACEFDTDCTGDGNFCNGVEVCVEGRCQSPGSRDCDDSNSCSADECVESAGMCVSTEYDDVLTNPMRCGTGANDCIVCPTPAPALNQVAVCSAGACGVACAEGFGDADGMSANGCECTATAGDDRPEPTFADTNCDGIDGDASIGVFVAPLALGGNDANPGTRDMPVATITRGIELARTSGRARMEVYVAAGAYAESIVLADGVSIFGGYNAAQGWRRSASFVSQIDGGTTAVLGSGLTRDSEVQLFTIVSAGATAGGESSYGVRIVNSTGLVTLRLNTIRSGNGAAGAPGTDGAPGAGGQDGRRGFEGCNGCSGFTCASTPCGSGGASACAPGGAGGNGGHDGGGGAAGSPGTMGSATGTAGPGGSGGGAAAVCFASSGAGGTPSVGGGNGGNGTNAAAPVVSIGVVASGLYAPPRGTDGTPGTHGGGGGGGGGAGGGRASGVCNADRGGSGGGGGGGGCAGTQGLGGGGGGGSFGIFASSARIDASGNTIISGTGGNGGRGGNGGDGGGGGNGGAGGNGADDARGGGNGGSGGRGGNSGSGSGGPGGPSYGIFAIASAVTSSSNAITASSPGSGGAGGSAALGSAPGGLTGAAGSAYSM
ncbi:RNA-binding protein [Sandaracinus amylolyticus]|uniref:RNA-binding protein n=1 Tax=Sandaracinus amylolyticus TaxID=927083 RepID=A0A0F6SDC0_9BACT|nr:RNA-binding protein [Sandaracinus amylolyticus]